MWLRLANNASSRFDPASLLILERLNEVLQRLDGDSTRKARDATHSNIVNGSESPSHAHARVSLEGTGGAQYDHESQVPHGLNGLQVPSSFSSTDSVLAWPVFGGKFRRGYLAEELYIADHLSSQMSDDSPYTQTGQLNQRRSGICEEEIPGLVSKFLQFVHIKNPILDPRSVRKYASIAAEHGLGWDAPSCVVVSHKKHFEHTSSHKAHLTWESY